MLTALLVFLVGALILCVIIYVAHLVIAMLKLPEPINQIAVLIVGLICLVALIMLCVGVYNGTWRVGDLFR
jgi:hypothetical protein